MKKLLLLPFVLMACVFIASCTAEFEEDQMIGREERTAELKAEIMKMAEDYDLTIKVKDEALSANIDNVNLDSIEIKMQGLSKVKGKYGIKNFNKDANIVSFRQDTKTTRGSFNRLVYEYNHTYKELNGYAGLYGHCIIDWHFENNGRSIGGSLTAFVADSPWATVPTASSHNIFVRDSGYGVIFYGPVYYEEDYYNIEFYVSGSFDRHGGSVDWS